VLFVDLDPRWVKRLIGMGEIAMARKYQEHVIDQAATIIRHRNITCMFTTPRLLENLAERMSLVKAGLKAVFAGGTTMTPQYVRFVVEEVLEGKINFAPTYGNTLMGLAISRKLKPEDNYSLTYYSPQPRRCCALSTRQALRTHALRGLRAGRADHHDAGIFRAAVPRTRRSHPPAAVRRVSLGRGRRRAPVPVADQDHHRGRLLNPPSP
jgi:hypothetical protein